VAPRAAVIGAPPQRPPRATNGSPPTARLAPSPTKASLREVGGWCTLLLLCPQPVFPARRQELGQQRGGRGQGWQACAPPGAPAQGWALTAWSPPRCYTFQPAWPGWVTNKRTGRPAQAAEGDARSPQPEQGARRRPTVRAAERGSEATWPEFEGAPPSCQTDAGVRSRAAGYCCHCHTRHFSQSAAFRFWVARQPAHPAPHASFTRSAARRRSSSAAALRCSSARRASAAAARRW